MMTRNQVTKWMSLNLLTLSIVLLAASLPSCSHTQAAPTITSEHLADTAPAQMVSCATLEPTSSRFAFAATADIRKYSGPTYHSTQYYRGATEAIANLGSGTFTENPSAPSIPTSLTLPVPG